MASTRSPSPGGSDSDAGGFDFMEEPSSFRPATPPPTIRSYKRRKFGGHGPPLSPSSDSVEVGLVSGHPLWGHILYPAAIAMSRFLELHSDTLLRSTDGKGKGKAVIELGAGGGLPGLVAALEGADQVVISDFPDPALVNNLAKNVEMNIEKKEGIAETKAMGFTWGSTPAPLFEAINDASPSSAPAEDRKFDLILLSDLVFNHSQHAALLDSCLSLLSPSLTSPQSAPSSTEPLPLPLPEIDLSENKLTTPAVLCFFSHHRPTQQLIEADLGILSLARARGWKVTRVWKDEGAGPAFPEDEGDLCIRGTVHGWAFTRE
ncbi:hypothetical protein BCR35DRAFT_306495 [Leucosporidium creatinivorum]|uniref:Methyltransferase-domain-containing protein n=1 Tax=Leucosporidium creatinivorum TaxID=106004 RepID=A0A1Y2EU16_9BASI|nr:hypothetical protein BCR35DRAFT_306495 [Leucosporidium creatinivorum]